ncbi:hypothetical protein ACFS07_08590 [Undibacterium arcticum]
MAGLGREALRVIGVDSAGQMDLAALRSAVERDRAEGLTPFFFWPGPPGQSTSARLMT